MDYITLFHCQRCVNYSSFDGCSVKYKFDDNNPLTNPFLCCPFYQANYDLMLPQSGDFYVLNIEGILYTPIFMDLEVDDYLTLKKCEIKYEKNITYLILDLGHKYSTVHKKRQYIIDNSLVIRIDKTLIINKN